MNNRSQGRAMGVDAWGSPDDLAPRTVELPGITGAQVAIEVRAAACNFFDALLIAGRYQERPAFPVVPGAEISGVVTATGPDATRFDVGQRVLAMLPHGGYASHVVADGANVYAIDDAMSFEHAAAFGIVYQTSYFGLAYRAGIAAGETLVVHAAAGGVGLAAVQLGRALGARVFGTAGSNDKCALARAHGAEDCFNYREVDWRARVLELTEGRGADVIYDPVGGDVFDTSLRTLAFGGRLLVIGFASGRIPSVAANYVLLKNISVVGLHWGAYRRHDPERIHTAMDELMAMYRRGAITPLVSNTWPLEQAATALEALTSRATVGKVLLIP